MRELPLILPSSARSLLVGVPGPRSNAHLLRTHRPGLAKLLRVLQQTAPSRGEVVLGDGVEVTAETAQASPVRRGCRYLEIADTVPEYLDPDLRVDDHAVDRPVDVQSVRDGVRNVHLLPVHLHPHFLAKVHFQVADLQHVGS